MGRISLELAQRKFNTKFSPVMERSEYYERAVIQIRGLLQAYFIDQKLTGSLEDAQQHQRLSRCNKIINALKKSFLDESESPDFYSDSNKTFIQSLDEHLECHLKLKIKNNCYELLYPESYTQKAHDYLQQLACALTAYRTSLLLRDVFRLFMQNSYFTMQEQQDCVWDAEELEKAVKAVDKDVVCLNALFLRAKMLKGNCKKLLKTVHHDPEGLREKIVECYGKLPLLLRQTCTAIEEAYKKTPNKAKVAWLIWDEAFQALMQSISGHLFNNYYKASRYYSSLSIRIDDFLVTLTSDLESLQKAFIKAPNLKIALLNQALQAVDKSLRKIIIRATQEGIILQKPAPVRALPTYPGLLLWREDPEVVRWGAPLKTEEFYQNKEQSLQ